MIQNFSTKAEVVFKGQLRTSGKANKSTQIVDEVLMIDGMLISLPVAAY